MPAFSELSDAVKSLARNEGVSPSPHPGAWALKLSEAVPYHRGNNAGLSLAVAVSGSKTVRLAGQEVVNDSGNVIALHGETDYDAVVDASQQAPYIALKLQLPPDLLATSLIRFAETKSKTPAAVLPAAVFCEPLDETLASPLVRLLESFRDPADTEVITPLCLQEICYRLLRSDAFAVLRASIGNADERLAKAAKFIEVNASRNLTVAEVASEFAMSPSHFAHSFTALFGQSPMQYRKQVRLESARQYLLGANTTVSGAAELAGYASPSQFTRDFKNAFGLSPRQFANEMTPVDAAAQGA